MDELMDTPETKAELHQISKDFPANKSPLFSILGLQNGAGGAGGEEGKEADDPSVNLAEAKGCTANVSLIKDGKIYCANAGDSRCVIGSKGLAIDLSSDHKPDLETEKQRIHKAGSEVTEGRVDGNLNLSRSLGDLKYKRNSSLPQEEQSITGYPDVKVHTITPDDDFMIMACDGIWEAKTSQEIVDFVYERYNKNKNQKLTLIVEEMLDWLLSPDYTAT